MEIKIGQNFSSNKEQKVTITLLHISVVKNFTMLLKIVARKANCLINLQTSIFSISSIWLDDKPFFWLKRFMSAIQNSYWTEL